MREGVLKLSMLGLKVLFSIVTLVANTSLAHQGQNESDETDLNHNRAIPEWWDEATEREKRLPQSITVCTEVQRSEDEATRELERMIRDVTLTYLSQVYEKEDASRILSHFPSLEFVRFEEHFSVRPYHDPDLVAAASELKMKSLESFKGFAELDFSSTTLERFEQVNKDLATIQRLAEVALAIGSAVGLVTIAFVSFRLNHATRGFHTKRIQTLAAILFIALAGFVAMVVMFVL
ncbi:MAG: hypothetical protein R3C03_14595 [Pirellulaceae bacterium]